MKKEMKRVIDKLGKQLIPKYSFVPISVNTTISKEIRAYYLIFGDGAPNH